MPRGASNVYIPQKENYISIPKNDFLSLDLDTNRYLKLLFADNLDEINKFDEDNKLASTELENLQASATEKFLISLNIDPMI